MSAQELKSKKPKYPENIEGTHCMGSHWTVCCPNKHLKYDRYQPTKEVIQIRYRGGIYRLFVCTNKCLKDITEMANNPDKFQKTFIKGVKPNGDLILKHRDTGIFAQIAQKIDEYDEKGGRPRKRKGGSIKKWILTNKRRHHKKGCGHTKKHRKL